MEFMAHMPEKDGVRGPFPSLPHDTLDDIADEDTDNKDNCKKDDRDEDPDAADQAGTDAKQPGNEKERDDGKEDAEHDADDASHFEKPPLVFFSAVEESVRNTDDQNKQFKPQGDTPARQ